MTARIMRIGGFAIAYGSLLLAAAVVVYQCYRWLHDGQWDHIGVGDGLRSVLAVSGVREDGGGRLAQMARWLAVPTDWLGWHEVLETIPASVALFLLAVLGNFAYIFGSDALRRRSGEST